MTLCSVPPAGPRGLNYVQILRNMSPLKSGTISDRRGSLLVETLLVEKLSSENFEITVNVSLLVGREVRDTRTCGFWAEIAEGS